MKLNPSTFGSRVQHQWSAALAAGALAPIETEVETCADGGVEFQLRVVSSAAKKKEPGATPPTDPFAPPYEAPLVVGEVAPAHLCLLNKFPVFKHHALLVTTAFEPQQAWLTEADFTALLNCLGASDALAFYNSGPVAGASQPHKHLQVVPLPLVNGGHGTPMDSLIRSGRLPFRHAQAAAPRDAAGLRQCSEALLRQTLASPGAPYNLLLTREWMLVVPRSLECAEGVSINALGFAGSLLTTTHEHLAVLRAGPMRLLRQVTSPG